MTRNWRAHIASEFQKIQTSICKDISQIDGGAKFSSEKWERPGGGGGNTRVLHDGAALEKAGVNFSAVHGALPEQLAKEYDVETGSEFFATGVSIVMHPFNPWVPIIHMNIRYMELANGQWWFGGGIDLTPHIIEPATVRIFHTQVKALCDKHNAGFYKAHKKWADDYFYLPHRKETRGVGGIFFDRLGGEKNDDRTPLLNYSLDIGRLFAPLYGLLINQNRQRDFTEEEKEWQMLRRGRYVEFNLVWDKGTQFGLHTGGRIESILMSLPRYAGWDYNFTPEAGSAMDKTQKLLKKDMDWVQFEG